MPRTLYINHNSPGYLPDTDASAYDVPDSKAWPYICATVRDYAESMAFSLTVTQSRELARDVLQHGESACYVPDCATGHTVCLFLSIEESAQ